MLLADVDIINDAGVLQRSMVSLGADPTRLLELQRLVNTDVINSAPNPPVRSTWRVRSGKSSETAQPASRCRQRRCLPFARFCGARARGLRSRTPASAHFAGMCSRAPKSFSRLREPPALTSSRPATLRRSSRASPRTAQSGSRLRWKRESINATRLNVSLNASQAGFSSRSLASRRSSLCQKLRTSGGLTESAAVTPAPPPPRRAGLGEGELTGTVLDVQTPWVSHTGATAPPPWARSRCQGACPSLLPSVSEPTSSAVDRGGHRDDADRSICLENGQGDIGDVSDLAVLANGGEDFVLGKRFVSKVLVDELTALDEHDREAFDAVSQPRAS